MGSNEEICRFCLKKCDDNFEDIGVITKDMLNILLVKTNLAASDIPVMCADCSDIIQKCFDFKAKCLSTEDYIVSFIRVNGKSSLVLKDVYRKKTKNKEIPDEHSICRFCVNLIENEDEVRMISEREMLENYLPELDVTVTKEPVICSLCHGYLQNYFSFIRNCSVLEEMINKYYEAMNRQGLIKLKDVIQFAIKGTCEEGDGVGGISDTENKPIKEENQHIKEEEMEEQQFNNIIQCSSRRISVSEDNDNKIEIKLEEMDYQQFLSCGEIEIKTDQHDFDSSKYTSQSSNCQSRVSAIQTNCNNYLQNYKLIHKNPSKVKMFHCESCSYQAKCKIQLQSHILTHKYPSEIKKFRCESCSYRTNLKRSLQSHMLIHKNPSELKMFECESCSYQSRLKWNLRQHLLIHKNPSEIKMFKCASCPYQAKLKGNLEKHMLNKHIHKYPSEK